MKLFYGVLLQQLKVLLHKNRLQLFFSFSSTPKRSWTSRKITKRVETIRVTAECQNQHAKIFMLFSKNSLLQPTCSQLKWWCAYVWLCYEFPAGIGSQLTNWVRIHSLRIIRFYKLMTTCWISSTDSTQLYFRIEWMRTKGT